jgi:hypothetical protein
MDPYSPPAEPVASSAFAAPAAFPAPRPLFSSGQVIVASFFASPLAGFVLLALNARRRGENNRAILTLVAGLLCTALFVAAGIALPVGKLSSIGMLPTIAIALYAKQHDTTFDQHIQAGGKKASGWATAGIGIATLATLFGATVAILWATGYGEDPSVAFGPDEHVYYVDGATEEDARRVGAYLQKAGMFTGHKEIDVKTERDRDGIAVSFVVGDGRWDEPGVIDAFGAIREGLAKDAFPGKTVTVKLCDATLTPKRSINE